MLSDADERLEVEMRHPPSEASVRLLESLGVSWRVDPRAPRCERGCDHPACRANLSRDDLDAVRLLIDERTRSSGILGVRERVERAIEHGVRIVRDPRDVNLLDRTREAEAGLVYVDRECRTDGCENRMNARYDRGAYVGLCWEKCIPARREVLSAGGRKRHGLDPTDGISGAASPIPGGLPVPAPRPAPEPEPDPPAPVEEAATFTDVSAALEAARDHLRDAEAGFRTALERFVEHPLYVSLHDEIETLR